jgi:hypothetical protein
MKLRLDVNQQALNILRMKDIKKLNDLEIEFSKENNLNPEFLKNSDLRIDAIAKAKIVSKLKDI